MLRLLTNKDEDKINWLNQRIWDNDYYKYYNLIPYRNSFKIADDNYNQEYYVSVDKNDTIIGLITYSIDRMTNSVYDFGAINFTHLYKTDTECKRYFAYHSEVDLASFNLIFGNDLNTCIKDIFTKYNFDRLEFECVEENPAIKKYQKIVNYCFGRLVGTLTNSVRLRDNKLYNVCIFEIMCECYSMLSTSYTNYDEAKKEIECTIQKGTELIK